MPASSNAHRAKCTPIEQNRLARQKAEQEKGEAERRAKEQAATGVVEAGADGSFDLSAAAAPGSAAAAAPAPTAAAAAAKQDEGENEKSERNARTCWKQCSPRWVDGSTEESPD